LSEIPLSRCLYIWETYIFAGNGVIWQVAVYSINLKDFILIIPFLDNKAGLLKSLRSIEFPRERFEVIIVDDGSCTPLTAEDLIEFGKSGSVIRILRLNENKGVAHALNYALAELKKRDDYKYIARLDCGDLCLTDRFKKQVTFLDEHPEIHLLGTRVLFKNFETGKEYIYQNKIIEEEIRKEMHFKCSFIHPSVMFRKEVLKEVGVYPENYLHCEDYAFFYKIIRQKQASILPEVLLISEISDQGVSSNNRQKQLFSRMRVVTRFGTNPVYVFGGMIRLMFLMLMPLPLVRFLKTRK
jgi:glycosyltransferase involved in cell wall biosynthesis